MTMKHSALVIVILLTGSIFHFSCKTQKPAPADVVAIQSSQQIDFIASISQVWADSIQPNRKVTLANIEGSNQFIGTDERYGEEGIINLQGVTRNFELNWTTMIKIKQSNFPKRYISYKGILTDTTNGHKRMTAYSAIDTLYLKALPPPAIKK